MTYRKYMPLVVGGSIALVLLIVAGYLLARFSGEYHRVHADLVSSMRTLERLENREPYPAEENVERLRRNRAAMELMLNDLIAELGRGQVEAERMERAEFPTLIERTILRLYDEARAANTRLPERFTFAFERYALGALPSVDHIPRLTVQVRMVERLCRMLFESGVSEIISVERTAFDLERPDEPDPTVRRRTAVEPAAPAVRDFTELEPREDRDLYSKERFVLEFFSTDPALWRVLNSMASDDMFVVVKNMELRNEAVIRGRSPLELRRTPRDERTDPRRDADRPLTTDERIVAGRERVRVRLELEVYRFERNAEEDS